MFFIIKREDIKNLIEELTNKYQIIAPQEKNGETVFDFIDENSKVNLEYENLLEKKNTLLPPKRFLFPPQEEVFTYDKKIKKITQPSRSKKKFLIFGVTTNDLKGIIFLDGIMTRPAPDYFYLRNRKKFVLIAVSYNKTTEGYYCGDFSCGDLILEKISDGLYKAIPVTEEGKKIARSEFFQKTEKTLPKNNNEERSELQELLLDSELLAEAVLWSKKNSKIWDELAEICLGCGICTYVCPLCYCFSFEDKMSLDGNKCSRCRVWDACTLPDFAKIAGGKNFRPTLKDRYFNWFYHKFVRGYREYGKALCIACARCQRYCPARIDIEKVLTRILNEYQNYAPKNK